ncbi:Uma2 family endonuclease [Methylogaea oryzae]|uniref:Restriction endonuclease n=1 Tax=Methylogaea oryzae TaxID=1295382 RepID=A0A8D5AI91_9GAMM|nr:Uma2 family endonuclease [Methylogaea oryzae]BBL72283.1 restriction endonuclease [Methylogaea oryzae]
MSRPAERTATYEDLCQVPDHLLAQIIHGQLITLPRPAPKHARASSMVGGKLVPAYDEGRGGPGGWWILDEPELHLGLHVLVPDLAGWRRERLPALPDTSYFDLAPDWVCEVLSPSTARMDRADKLPIYAAHGVGHAWLIDPDAQTLEVFALVDGRWRLECVHQKDDEVRAPPFEALGFGLGALWG